MNWFVSYQYKSEKIFVSKVAYRIATSSSIVMRWISIESEQLNLSKDGLYAEFDSFDAVLYLNWNNIFILSTYKNFARAFYDIFQVILHDILVQYIVSPVASNIIEFQVL